MSLKEEFSDILWHPNKIRPVTKAQDELYSKVVPDFLKKYQELDVKDRLTWAVSAASYLFGKSMEIAILGKIRPKEKSVWIVRDEVDQGITFDLPKHLEDKVIDYMDPFESAVEDYIAANPNVNISNLWKFSQHYGFSVALKDKLYECTVAGLSNEEVLTNNELYRFGMNAFKNEMEKHGYKILSIARNLIEYANVVLEKNNVKYLTATSVRIMPNEGYIADWRIDRLISQAKKYNAVPCISYIGLIPLDELYSSMGVAIKKGQYKVEIKKLTNLLTGEFVA